MGPLSFSFSLYHRCLVVLMVVTAIALSSTAVPRVSGGVMFNKLTRRVSVAGDEDSGYGLYGTQTATADDVSSTDNENDKSFDDVTSTDNDETKSSKNDKDEKKEDGSGGERYMFDSMEEYDKYVEAQSHSPSRN